MAHRSKIRAVLLANEQRAVYKCSSAAFDVPRTMKVVDVHSHEPRVRRSVFERILIWQWVCFIVFALFLGLHQMGWIAAAENGSARTSAIMGHLNFLWIGTLVLGIAATLPLYFCHRRNSRRSVTICCYCRRVQLDDCDWQAIEAYFADSTGVTYSHGVCPECGERELATYRERRRETPRESLIPSTNT